MSSTHATRPGTTAARSPLQWAALIVGAVFLLVGIAGFIPGLTSNYGDLTFASHHSEAMLLGIFAVSVLHNVVHLAFGVAGLVMARTPASARLYLIVGGIVYAVLWLYGLVIDPHSSANFVPVNSADNWLHFALAVLMIGLGAALGRQTTLRATNGEGNGAPGTLN